MLGPQPVSSARTARAFPCRAIPPGPVLILLYMFIGFVFLLCPHLLLHFLQFIIDLNAHLNFQKLLLCVRMASALFPLVPVSLFPHHCVVTLKDSGGGWRMGHFSGRTFTSVSRLRHLNQTFCFPNSFICTKHPLHFLSYRFFFFLKHCVVLLSAL